MQPARGSAAHALDQPLDPGVLAQERVLAQHGSLGLVVELEVHPVDGEVAPVLLGGPDEVAAQLGAGGLAAGAPWPGRSPGRSPPGRSGRAVGAGRTALGCGRCRGRRGRSGPAAGGRGRARAWSRSRSMSRCLMTQSISVPTRARSPVSTAVRVRSQSSSTRSCSGSLEPSRATNSTAFAWYSRCRSSALSWRAVGQPHGAAAGGVVGDLADGADRVLQGEVAHDHARLDHPQHEVAGPDLEHRGRLAHVRVADDDVQPPVVLGVGVRLVAGVDDRPAAGGRRRHALPDVVGPLAHGVRGALGRGAPACRRRR